MKFADSARQFWDVLSGKQRMLLGAGGAVVLAALIYVFLLEPALAARKQLSAALPLLRAQVEDMRQQQKEIPALRKKVAATSQRGELKVLLQASIARSSFVNAVERIESLSADKARVLAAPVIFDDWIDWTRGLQRDIGIRLEVCKITATEQPGLVRVEATFTQSGQPDTRKSP
jgi:general secretion pathway protein M